MSLWWFMRALRLGGRLFSSIISKAQNEVIRKQEAEIISSLRARVSHTREHEFISPSSVREFRFSRTATLCFVLYTFAWCKLEKIASTRSTWSAPRISEPPRFIAADCYVPTLVLFVVHALQREFQRQLKQVYSSSCNWNPVLRYERHEPLMKRWPSKKNNRGGFITLSDACKKLKTHFLTLFHER